jgi:hypothetical protein
MARNRLRIAWLERVAPALVVFSASMLATLVAVDDFGKPIVDGEFFTVADKGWAIGPPTPKA